MKLHDVLFEASIKDQEWRFTESRDGPEYSLFTKYDSSRDFQYSATFVYGREDHFEFFKQGSLDRGDHIEFGSPRTTPREEFSTQTALNRYLTKNRLPTLSEEELNKLHPDDVIMIGVGEKGAVKHYFRVSLSTLAEWKGGTETVEDFLNLIRTALKKVIRKNGWFMNGDQLTDAAQRALSSYYGSGKRPKPTI